MLEIDNQPPPLFLLWRDLQELSDALTTLKTELLCKGICHRYPLRIYDIQKAPLLAGSKGAYENAYMAIKPSEKY
ncbi:hypothetical protein MTX78_12655 [Hymenobacter tibetensis]|uniref:HEPN domain-containing protein n=1 Tax=Hymenobacter tibetensis TaxID=497967 RepID=A0ABY4CRT5_9BACT|nr:hypothetical protein [Hymenobacter tibetensis]UOG72978.1 hypothetical protein MTX78_12655 [Hymenobacter tibetensis]